MTIRVVNFDFGLLASGRDLGVKVQEDAIPALAWLEQQARRTDFQVSELPLTELRDWRLDGEGNLSRPDGSFFSVEGLQVDRHLSNPLSWQQPIINQNEVGLLGLLIRRNWGVVEGLFQAKAEPGHLNIVQLGPTVQATRSNFLRAHGGQATMFMEWFKPEARASVVVDVLQSEQGSRFLRKRNRNMIVEVDAELEAPERFRWIPLRSIRGLLSVPDVVNMDARSVLSSLPFVRERRESWLEDAYTSSHYGELEECSIFGGFNEPEASRHTVTEILSWLTRWRQEFCLTSKLLPLRDIDGWLITDQDVRDENNNYFRVLGVRAEISGREVLSWDQPLLAPTRPGVHAFLTKHINDQLHVLVKAKSEAGTADGVEIGPTVQCWPRIGDPTYEVPTYLDRVLNVRRSDILYQGRLSEEGGRFFRESNHYFVLAAEDLPEDEPDGFLWITPAQLSHFCHYTGVLNIEARSLLACLLSQMGALGAEPFSAHSDEATALTLGSPSGG